MPTSRPLADFTSLVPAFFLAACGCWALLAEEPARPEKSIEAAIHDKAARLEVVKAGISEAAKSGKKVFVWVAVFRDVEKTELAGADADAVSVKIQGNVIRLPWEKLQPEQIADVAKDCIQNDAQRALALADFCLAHGLTRKVDEALTLAAQCDTSLGEAFTRRMAQLQEQRDAVQAKTTGAVREAMAAKAEGASTASTPRSATGSAILPTAEGLSDLPVMPWPGDMKKESLPPEFRAATG